MPIGPRHKEQWKKNLWLGLALAALIAILYYMAIVKLESSL